MRIRKTLLVALLTVVCAGLAVPAAQASFGLSEFDVTFTGPHGEEVTQAGSHPFEMTTSFAINTVEREGGTYTDKPVKDLEIPEIPGFIGNTTAVPQCSRADFLTSVLKADDSVGPSCPNSSALGIVAVALMSSGTVAEPIWSAVYELEPPPGVAVELGFWTGGVPITIEVGVAESQPYNVIAHVRNISQLLEVRASQFILWGVPASPVHDKLRGQCVGGATPEPTSYGTCSVGLEEKPFLTLPRACSGPLATTYALDSWEDPGARLANEEPNLADPAWLHGSVLTHTAEGPQGMTVCGKLAFSPEVGTKPTTRSASSPTGLDFSLNVEDEGLLSAEGHAQSDIKKVEVTLPEGMTANPALAEGLAACSEAALEREVLTAQPGEGCPEESKIGSVEVETPLLPQTLNGSLYLATPYANPFKTLLGLYVVIKNRQSGILIKLPGEVVPNQQTGRLTSVFDNLPQLPFSHFDLKFRQGQRSPLVTPPLCGSYVTQALLTPYANPEATLQDGASFEVSSGVAGGACPSGGVPPFKPGVVAGTLNNAAGAHTAMDIQITRKDGEQEITGFSTVLPPGLTASLTGVPLCSEGQIAAAEAKSGAEELAHPSCPAASQIGRTQVGVGVGAVLAYTPGRLYMAGPYQGAPFSVVSITSATVGPFDLGTVVVHLPLNIDLHTAQVSIPQGNADQIPHIVKGIVVHVRDIRVEVDRPDFVRNPTSCTPMSLQATVFGSGANFVSAADNVPSGVTDRFQAADCQALPFNAKLSALTHAKHTRKGGAYLHVVVQSGEGQAGIKEVHVELPEALPSELKTLQKACTQAQFEADPAGCPAESVVGHAVVRTPILPVPLSGPAYFVSHGGVKFPELVIVLQGDGVTIQLNGDTFISKGITSSTFKSVPDQPFTRFSIVLPTGSHSALAGNGNFCHEKLNMPTRIIAQSGKRIEQTTKIMVQGCKPEMWIVKHRVHGAKATIFVHVPSAGKLIANGKGIKRKVKKVTKEGGRVGITVRLTRQMRRKLRHGHHKHVKVKVHLKFKPKHGKAFAKKVKLRLR